MMEAMENVTDEKIETQDTEPSVGDASRHARSADAASIGTEDPLVGAVASATSAAAPAYADAQSPLQEENERLRGERDALLERMARLQAEFDNARKREARERTDYRAFAISDAVEQFLPVLDNFRLALSSPGSAEQFRTGVELIAKQMEEVLRSLNVTPVETVGVAFDPRVHEALESVERADLPDHQVIDEVRRGYRIKDRLLRPALVRIASNPGQTEA
jgi:molecular chaperone GrpE